MSTSRNVNDEILFHAEKVLYYNDLLVKQCDGWLSEKEGNENMMKQIMERERATRAAKINRVFNGLIGMIKTSGIAKYFKFC